jgi:hypothetical protein
MIVITWLALEFKICIALYEISDDDDNNNNKMIMIIIIYYRRRLTFWLHDASTSITFNNCTFCPHFIYVLCKQRLMPLTAWTDRFYNRDEKFLLCDTDWAFK